MLLTVLCASPALAESLGPGTLASNVVAEAAEAPSPSLPTTDRQWWSQLPQAPFCVNFSEKGAHEPCAVSRCKCLSLPCTSPLPLAELGIYLPVKRKVKQQKKEAGSDF